MEDKKTLLIAAAIMVVLILATAASIGVYFYIQQMPSNITNDQPITNTQPLVNGSLPVISDVPTTTPEQQIAEELSKEKQFISSYYPNQRLSYSAAVKDYKLPIAKIKDAVINYRDFNRKLPLTDQSLDSLSTNGFLILTAPFANAPADWEGSYFMMSQKKLPILITSDALAGIYQDTLNIVFKETEEEIFYSSLWQLLSQLQLKVTERYNYRKQQTGIENDTIAEASRLELAYISVALKLLEPKADQIKETLAGQRVFFTPFEAENYRNNILPELTAEVSKEVALINKANLITPSPIFKISTNYSAYKVPENYKSSAKLNNYYLAMAWLNQTLFPLYYQENDCPECLYDQQDHLINFVASLYLTQDLAKDQGLKNRWANIYKSLSFFRGLEANLTYLDYNSALQSVFGKDYNLDKYFASKPEAVKDYVKKLQEKIGSVKYLEALNTSPENKQEIGLRLLRSRYLLENKLFDAVTSQAGNYIKKEGVTVPPVTACSRKYQWWRCWPLGLDLMNLLEIKTADKALTSTNNNSYQNYQKAILDIRSQFNEFKINTWHDNAYLSLLDAIKNLNNQKVENFPSFMKTPAWQNKNLASSMAIWANFHKELSLTKTGTNQTVASEEEFPYGYIEPQIDFYQSLLANTTMVTDGLTALQIITPTSKSYERLNNLKGLLQKAVALSQKELSNQALNNDDYETINNFAVAIKSISGDIHKTSLQNNLAWKTFYTNETWTYEYIDGLSYLLVIYNDPEGKLYFAIGPVLNHHNGFGKSRLKWGWLNEFKQE